MVDLSALTALRQAWELFVAQPVSAVSAAMAMVVSAVMLPFHLQPCRATTR